MSDGAYGFDALRDPFFHDFGGSSGQFFRLVDPGSAKVPDCFTRSILPTCGIVQKLPGLDEPRHDSAPPSVLLGNEAFNFVPNGFYYGQQADAAHYRLQVFCGPLPRLRKLRSAVPGVFAKKALFHGGQEFRLCCIADAPFVGMNAMVLRSDDLIEQDSPGFDPIARFASCIQPGGPIDQLA